MKTAANFFGEPLLDTPIAQGYAFRELTVFMGGFTTLCEDLIKRHFSFLIDQETEVFGQLVENLIADSGRGALMVVHPEAWANPSDLPEIADNVVRLILAGFEAVLFTHSTEILARLGVITAASEIVRKAPELSKKVEEVVAKDLWLPKDYQVGAFFIDKGKLIPMADGNLIDGSPTATVLEECFSQYEKLLGVK